MKLEVLLSTLNLNKKDLNKMNINCSCIVINQCNINTYEEYNNFKIYSFNDKGTSISRNKALKICDSDIAIFCDDDVVYEKNFAKIIIEEFNKNKDADIILFNFESPNRNVKINKNNKRARFYNSLRYGAYNIAFRVKSIKDNHIYFNELFGGNCKYSHGEDTLFIVECLNKRLKLYKSTKTIGIVNHKKSSWFKGFNKEYFYNKGVLFYVINNKLYKLLCLQYLIRHKEVLNSITIKEAYKYMLSGIKDYKDSYEK